MTKREVIEYLGKSKRTIETYIGDGRLPVRYCNGPNGKAAIFDRANVEAFKLELAAIWEPARRPATAEGGTALTPISPRQLAPIAPSFDAAAIRSAITEAITSTRVKPWLGIDDAARFSGLPKSWLRLKAPSGMYGAVNVGTDTRERWMFSRNALKG